ncbi:MAG TPA: GGDEF domain-containing phosphodiesterase [Rectinemataceae bacterium]|nr:GGDEF domain-containing phosphodiesterase [Rectinemataceae bacterium]
MRTDDGPLDENSELISEIEELRNQNDLQRKKIADLERRMAIQPQTGLPTRYRLEIELDELIEGLSQKRDRRGFTLLILQLGDDYANLRKTLKTSVSEWILYQTGTRISSMLRPGDLLFHTHENEFVVALLGLKGAELSAFLRVFLVRLGEPHIFAGLNISLKTSAGAAYWPEHGSSRTQLLQSADIAAGASRDRHRSFTLYSPSLLSQAVQKVELQNAITKAIESIDNQFFLLYQPKIIASSLVGNRLHVSSVEAEVLIRWRHPEKGIMSPEDFIPLAEETGLIMPLGKWLIYQSTRKLVSTRAAAHICSGMSINLSARQFHSDDAATVLAMALSRSGAAPRDLTIELTETGLFDEPSTAARALGRFKDIGVRISMDDFGTGYSSLSHLHSFPLHEIKIDKQFVERLDSSSNDRVIVSSLVSIAKGMNLDLIAEGVETPEAVKVLWEMGCTGFQGFLFARPLDEGDFIEFCNRIERAGMIWDLAA